jgi:trigger factor
MATVTRENIGLLHDKITVTVSKDDYYPSFDKALKQYSKTANIPGFRKGMVPAGMIKKMHGSAIFSDEVIKSIEKEMGSYMEREQLEIFAQPLPGDNDMAKLDMNQPGDYHFSFEVGLKPAFTITDLGKGNFTRYVVTVTDEMINEELNRVQNRAGKMTEPEAVDNDDNVLNLTFTEADAQGNVLEGGITKDNSLLVKYFAEGTRPQLMGKQKDDTFHIQLQTAFDQTERDWVLQDLGLDKSDPAAAQKYFNLLITKVGFVEKAELNEELFNQVYPGKAIATEEEFRNAIRDEIAAHWAAQARNQTHDQIYHALIDQTPIELPESFLKQWMQKGGEKPKTAEEADKEYPAFSNSLRWTLISDQIAREQQFNVTPDELRAFARNQVLGYMGMQLNDQAAPWIDDYAERMMKDKKYVEDTYHRILTDKLFAWAETQIQPTDKSISAADFKHMVENHHH